MLDLLAKLNKQGVLDEFLDKAEKYWSTLSVFRIAELEREKGGGGVMATIKKDWSRIWPESLESERTNAFEQFKRFWGRLDRSKLVDDVMQDVLPDMANMGKVQSSKDLNKLRGMTDEERNTEIVGRIGKAAIVKQYTGLSSADPQVKSIGGKMMPFIAKAVSILELKVAAETEELAQNLDQVLIIGGGVLVALIVLFATGIIPSPLQILWDVINWKI